MTQEAYEEAVKIQTLLGCIKNIKIWLNSTSIERREMLGYHFAKLYDAGMFSDDIFDDLEITLTEQFNNL